MNELRRIEIKESFSYKAIKTLAKYMDEYFLDPLIGFIPEVGDILTTVFSLPFFLYVTIVKIKSLPLTLAVTYNFLLDTLIGMIPFMIGNVLDFFSKANIKNYPERFTQYNLPITKVALNFDSETRNISEWLIE